MHTITQLHQRVFIQSYKRYSSFCGFIYDATNNTIAGCWLGWAGCFVAGTAVLAPVLERADTEGLPAYLETQKEENLAYYARHRFELVQKIDIEGCPPIWTLRREPR